MLLRPLVGGSQARLGTGALIALVVAAIVGPVAANLLGAALPSVRYSMTGQALLLLLFALVAVALILGDSVKAIALQVCLYYGLAGLASAWAFRNRGAPITFLTYCVFPGLSALALFGLGAYALSTFDLLTRIVGVGGLLLGLVFWRPKGYRALV